MTQKSYKSIKIGICGSHGIGKSTLGMHLSALLKQKDPRKSVVCLEENVRRIAKLTDGKLNTIEFQKLAIADQIFREISNEILHDIIITDRTLLDYLVYGVLCGNSLPWEYFLLVKKHLKTFDNIYFVRPDSYDQKIVNDHFRDTDLEFRKKVDKKFKVMLRYGKIDYTEIKSSQILTYDYLKDLQ